MRPQKPTEKLSLCRYGGRSSRGFRRCSGLENSWRLEWGLIMAEVVAGSLTDVDGTGSVGSRG